MKHVRLTVIAGLLAGTLVIVVVMLVGADTPSTNAQRELGNAGECSLVAITVSAQLGSMPGVWDAQPGSAVDRQIYFSRPSQTGVITVSAQVSGSVPVCYVWSSPAFSVAEQTEFVLTPPNLFANSVYTVGSAHGPTATVVLTSSPYMTGSVSLLSHIVTLSFVQVQTTTVYLPVLFRDYPLANGDFENGWYGWTHGQGPFLGHGSGLTQSVTFFEGSHRALLGSPNYTNAEIPVGYAYMSQTVAVPPSAPILTFLYHVYSFDTVYGLTTHKYFDTFEFSIDQPPDQITDAERENIGCRTSALNPDGSVTFASSGQSLIFCAGGPPASSSGTEWDSGWRTARVNLSAFAGSRVTLYFANWNREYNDPWFNDHGYFNTYTYVDDVQFVSEP